MRGSSLLRPLSPPGLARAGVVALALAVGAPAVAQGAPRTARVCASRAILVESPGGAVTGIVHRGDQVRVLNGAHQTWWRVATTFGSRGWLRQASLCGEDR